MRLGFNGATTQTADLATDIRVAGQAGYDVIELRDGKLDQFLTQGSLDDVPPFYCSTASHRSLAQERIIAC